MNTCCLSGRLTRDPDIKYVGSNNTCIASFSIAVNRRFKSSDEQNVDFFNCVSFGKVAEFMEKYITKGMKVEVSGRLQQDRWTNKDGQTMTAVKVIADSVEFSESKAENEKHAAAVRAEGSAEPTESAQAPDTGKPAAESFVPVPQGLEEELPFT